MNQLANTKSHWITNCPEFKDGDETAEHQEDVDCDICLEKLRHAQQEGWVSNTVVQENGMTLKDVAEKYFPNRVVDGKLKPFKES